MVFSPFSLRSPVKRGDRLASFRRTRFASLRRNRVAWSIALALGATSFVALDMGTTATPVVAQPVSSLSTCEAPGPSEYLLLVVLQTEAARGKLTETLPPSVQAPTCNYLGSRVARMGGFQKPEDADAWASYLRDVASLPAFVAKPTQSGATTIAAATSPVIKDPAGLTAPAQPSAPQVTPTQAKPKVATPPLDVLPPPVIPSQPRLGAKIDVPQVGVTPPVASANNAQSQATVPTPVISPAAPPVAGAPPVAAAPSVAPPAATIAQASTPSAPKTPPAGTFSVTTYEPKLLSNGYVVLVDYGNQTSLVPLLRQLTKQSVGLASYGQRPFLMVNYTPDSKAALATLKTLDNSGFRTMLVDGGRVTLLVPDVQVK